jgi:hypothetical protein
VSAPGRLIDEYLPDFDVVERHATVVRARPARVWTALRSTDFGRSRLIGGLFALRTIPAVLTAPRETLRRWKEGRGRALTLDSILAMGFALLAERPERELLLGVEGRFWAARRDLRATDSQSFRAPLASGLARGAWDFRLEPVEEGLTRLSTETRVRCADAAARRRFLPYWLLVRPGSGLIRRAMLAAIRRAAETGP